MAGQDIPNLELPAGWQVRSPKEYTLAFCHLDGSQKTIPEILFELFQANPSLIGDEEEAARLIGTDVLTLRQKIFGGQVNKIEKSVGAFDDIVENLKHAASAS
jgi:hypothetical protein